MAHQSTNFDELAFHAELNLRREVPKALTLLGSPGVAKTAWLSTEYIRIVAKVYGVDPADVGYAEFKTAGKDAVEACGLMFPVKNAEGEMVTQNTKPALICEWEALSAQYVYVVFNFDELPQGQSDMLNVLRDVFHPDLRQLNGWHIPENIIFTGTGNRMADKSGAKRLPSHMVDCLMIFELQRDIDGWVRNYAEEHVNPAIVECAKAHAETDGFFADAVPAEDVSYCTLRSLTDVGRLLDAYMDMTPDFNGHIPPVLQKSFAAEIGPNAASIISQFMEQHDKIPTAEQIISDPEGALVPSETGFQALAGSIALSAANDAETGEAVITYMTRLRPDLQVSLASKLLMRSAKHGWYIGGPVAQEFLVKFHDLLPLAQEAGWR